QRLSAVESMAAVDVLCLDKTGTLTTNQLRLDRLHLLAPGLTEETVRDRLRLFASASVDRQNRVVQALRIALGDCPAELLDALPFKSQNRYSAVRIRDGDIERVLVLGACEALGGHLEAPAAEWEPVWTELVGSGLRVLLFAEARQCRPLGNSLDGWILQAMVLVALSDELRPEAGEVLEKLSGQGIAVKVISGDNPLTVHATVRQL